MCVNGMLSLLLENLHYSKVDPRACKGKRDRVSISSWFLLATRILILNIMNHIPIEVSLQAFQKILLTCDVLLAGPSSFEAASKLRPNDGLGVQPSVLSSPPWNHAVSRATVAVLVEDDHLSSLMKSQSNLWSSGRDTKTIIHDNELQTNVSSKQHVKNLLQKVTNMQWRKFGDKEIFVLFKDQSETR